MDEKIKKIIRKIQEAHRIAMLKPRTPRYAAGLKKALKIIIDNQ